MGVVVSLLVMLVVMVVAMVVVSVVAGGSVVVHLICLPSSASLTVARATWKGVLSVRGGPEKMAARMRLMSVGVVIVTMTVGIVGLVTQMTGMGGIVVVVVVEESVVMIMLLMNVVGMWVVRVCGSGVGMEVVLGVIMSGIGDEVDEKCE